VLEKKKENNGKQNKTAKTEKYQILFISALWEIVQRTKHISTLRAWYQIGEISQEWYRDTRNLK